MARKKKTADAAPAATVPRPRSKPQKEQADDSSDPEDADGTTTQKKKRTIVNWVKNPHWTHKIMEYLIDNPTFRIKLFSDSTAEAKKAGRQKLVGKDGKPQQYAQLAEYVFKDDPAEMVRFASNVQKYASAVETRLRRRVICSH